MTQVIQDAARRVAEAETAHAVAHDRHAAAVKHTETVRARIADAEQRRQGYRHQLAEGAIDAKGAGALLASVDEDIRDLCALLDGAVASAADLKPTREEQAVAFAQQQLAKAQAQAEFTALHAHAKQVETVFIGALAELGRLGMKLGNPASLGSIYTFDPGLRSAVAYNSIPGGSR